MFSYNVIIFAFVFYTVHLLRHHCLYPYAMGLCLIMHFCKTILIKYDIPNLIFIYEM